MPNSRCRSSSFNNMSLFSGVIFHAAKILLFFDIFYFFYFGVFCRQQIGGLFLAVKVCDDTLFSVCKYTKVVRYGKNNFDRYRMCLKTTAPPLPPEATRHPLKRRRKQPSIFPKIDVSFTTPETRQKCTHCRQMRTFQGQFWPFFKNGLILLARKKRCLSPWRRSPPEKQIKLSTQKQKTLWGKMHQ